MENSKEYSNAELTIVWKPGICIHSGICARGLPNVFKPREKPWIDQHGASSQEIMARIDLCPSKALSYYTHNEKPQTNG
ncbi:(4Fe-4S)-binding protein [Flavobacterium magnum]|uniref:(4Fe-4S)-binding protein n=1 Tax=Flavobacterium magnum TaxID=2162713 RepID=A0A2S0RE09_9FLAO|nr:(4Fe-4S)-binding protein [Flavobacterium magnum]AWA29530.1 (4Fe-4S)-binding protein [Flavobacterium magnum]